MESLTQLITSSFGNAKQVHKFHEHTEADCKIAMFWTLGFGLAVHKSSELGCYDYYFVPLVQLAGILQTDQKQASDL